METNKIIDRIVRELTKNDSAQSIVDNCQADLLDYFYWELKELEWEHVGVLKKANIFLGAALDDVIKTQIENQRLKAQLELLPRLHCDLEEFGKVLVDTVELNREMVREEMLLNLKEQHGKE